VAEDAEQVAPRITNPYRQAETLARVAWALAAAGQLERARHVAGDTEQLALSITDPYDQAEALAGVAEALAAAGQQEQAE
jgi:hypothetical protein